MISTVVDEPGKELRPLAYGYVRLPDGTPEPRVAAVMAAVADRAVALGFDFATTFRERSADSVTGWEEMITELRRAEAVHVIVPSLQDVEHLSTRMIMGRPEPDLVLYALAETGRRSPAPRWQVVHESRSWSEGARRPARAVFR